MKSHHAVQVRELPRRKGSGVATVDPGAFVTAVLSTLTDLGIGDVVNVRVRELEQKAHHLNKYLSGY